MTLKKGKDRKAINYNISMLVHAGYPQKQDASDRSHSSIATGKKT